MTFTRIIIYLAYLCDIFIGNHVEKFTQMNRKLKDCLQNLYGKTLPGGTITRYLVNIFSKCARKLSHWRETESHHNVPSESYLETVLEMEEKTRNKVR